MADPTLIEQIDRTVHTTDSGIEIVRRFYIEPYESHPEFLTILRGSVSKPGDQWIRTPPSHDPYIPNCYCNEARVDFAHEDAMASSPSIQDVGGVRASLEDHQEKPAEGTAGAIVTAHYRPLITAWDGEDNLGHSRWDWLDWRIDPGVRQLPWPDGLFVNGPLWDWPTAVPTEAGAPIAVCLHEFSIRRILVPQIPWEMIQMCAGCVNRDVFPTIPPVNQVLPTFPPRTLKFNGVTQQCMVDPNGKRWYELTYHFSWINQWDAWITDAHGNKESGWITWNHVFIHPEALFGLIGEYTGWYEVTRGLPFSIGPVTVPIFGLPFLQLRGGRLYNEADFMPLFQLNQ